MRYLLFIFSFFLLLFFGTSSCKKEKLIFNIAGIVQDETFDTGFANLPLLIEVQKSGQNFYTTFKTIKTDHEGRYNFSIDYNLYVNIRISAEKDQYFPVNRIIPFGNLSSGLNIYNLGIQAKSWARLIFINDNPSSTDELRYSKVAGKENCDECCSKNEKSIFGAANEIVICVNDANTDYSILYSVVNTMNTDIIGIITAPFDTTDLILHY